LGGNKLEEEVNKIDKDMGELFKEFVNPIAPLLHEHNLEKATNLIKRILNDIEDYKKKLSNNYNLNNFPEIHQLENSIRGFLKKLEEDYKLIRSQKRIKLDPIEKDIRSELYNIGNHWDAHKGNLHRLEIIK
jgi:hypothetical protein